MGGSHYPVQRLQTSISKIAVAVHAAIRYRQFLIQMEKMQEEEQKVKSVTKT